MRTVPISLIVWMVLFYFTACTDNGAPSEVEVLTFSLNTQKTPNINDIVEGLKIIPLKSDSEFLLRNVSKTLLYNDKLCVTDGTGIGFYNLYGEPEGHLHKPGRGPGEYTRITDFNVTDNYIIIADRNTKSFLIYSLTCDFIRGIKTDLWFTSFEIEGENIIVNASYDLPEDKFHVLNIETGSIVTTFYPMKDYQTNYMHFNVRSTFSHFNSELLFNEPLNENILKLDENGYKIKYKINFSSRNPSESFMRKNYSDVRDFMTKFYENDFVSGTPFFAEGDNSLFITYIGDSKLNGAVYNQNDGKSYVFDRLLIEDVSLDLELITFNYADQYLILTIPAVAFLEDKERVSLSGNEINVEDEPLVLIGKLS